MTPSGEQLNGCDREVGRRVLRRRAVEGLREELRVREIDLHDEPLARRVEMQPLDRRERRRVQQALGRLPRRLDVLVQHARGVVRGLDDERVAFQVTDRVAERRARTVLRVLLHVHVHDAAHVHPLVMQHDVVAVANDLERRAGRAPDAADRDRVATEHGIVLERVVGRDGFFARVGKVLHHRLRTARAAVRDRREQPGAEDVFASSRRRGRGPLRARRPVHAERLAVGELDAVEEAHVGAVARQRALHAQLRAGLEHLRRDSVARELRDAVRFADVLLRLAVLVVAAMCT